MINICSRNLVRRLVVVVLITGIMLCSSAVLSGAFAAQPKAEESFFFPYPFCLSLKIDKFVNENQDLRLYTTIGQALRGKCKQDSHLVFSIDQEQGTCSERLQSSLGALAGKHCVLAFNPTGRDIPSLQEAPQPLAITNLYLPFGPRQPTTSDIALLRAKLETGPYPYRACVEARVINSLSGSGTAKTEHSLHLLSRMQDVLLPDRRVPAESTDHFGRGAPESIYHANIGRGQLIKTTIPPNYPSEIMPARPSTNLKGALCIWSFNPRKEGDGLVLEDITAPFPGQRYTNSDKERLRAKLQLNETRLSQLRGSILKNLESRWSRARLLQYCRPDTRILPSAQSIKPWTGPVLMGRLFEGKEGALGKITWYTGLIGGEPGKYQIDIDAGGRNHWRIQDYISLSPYDDSDFKCRLIATILSTAMFAYARSHDQAVPAAHYLRQVHEVTLDSDGHLTARGSLQGGQQLVVQIGQDLSIRSITVDGRLDQTWADACKEAVHNIDESWAQEGM